jgi:hypothetical protein
MERGQYSRPSYFKPRMAPRTAGLIVSSRFSASNVATPFSATYDCLLGVDCEVRLRPSPGVEDAN